MDATTLNLIPAIYRAALSPEDWPSVITALMVRTGAIGAAYIVQNRKMGRVVSADIVGTAAQETDAYLDYYSRIDPYFPMLAAAAQHWLPLSELHGGIGLDRSEWYNDFILRVGVKDIAGICLAKTADWCVVLGMHFARDAPIVSRLPLIELTEPLQQAALLDLELRKRNLQILAAHDVLARAGMGIAVVDESGRLVESNAAAERIFRRADGLCLRDGHIRPKRAFEAGRLAGHLAAIASQPRSERRLRRMLVGRASGQRAYVISIVPLEDTFVLSRRTPILLLIADPDEGLPTADDLAELYGLSPAESRLAAALARGCTIAQISTQSGVAVTTLRTQTRAILKKVDVPGLHQLLLALSGPRLAHTDEPA